jgi:hypothetical protein
MKKHKNKNRFGVFCSPILAACFAVYILNPAAVSAGNLFNPYIDIPVESSPEAVAIGDVNNDGRNDVVLVTSYNQTDPANANQMYVFLQDASGHLAEPDIYQMQNSPSSVDIGDLDNDWRADVAVGSGDFYEVEVFTQDQSGSLNPSAIYPTLYAYKIKIGDLNDNGLQDIAGINWYSGGVGVLYQNRGGTLDPVATIDAMHSDYGNLDINDMNDDSLNDLVVISENLNAFDHDISINMQAAVTGGFHLPLMYSSMCSNYATDITTGDFNNDGRIDVALSCTDNNPGATIKVFLQNEFNTLDPIVSYATLDLPTTLKAADINSDGLDDLVVLHDGWLEVGVYLQQSDGSFGPEDLYPVPFTPWYKTQGLDVGDINGDSLPDVVIAHDSFISDENSLLVLYQNNTNSDPIADAGSDQIVSQRSTVLLDGSQSHDPDGTIVNYSWSQVSGMPVTLTPGDTPDSVSFEALQLKKIRSAELVFELAVTDDDGASAADQVLITVIKKRRKK